MCVYSQSEICLKLKYRADSSLVKSYWLWYSSCIQMTIKDCWGPIHLLWILGPWFFLCMVPLWYSLKHIHFLFIHAVISPLFSLISMFCLVFFTSLCFSYSSYCVHFSFIMVTRGPSFFLFKVWEIISWSSYLRLPPPPHHKRWLSLGSAFHWTVNWGVVCVCVCVCVWGGWRYSYVTTVTLTGRHHIRRDRMPSFSLLLLFIRPLTTSNWSN